MLALPQSDSFIAEYDSDVHSYIVGTKQRKTKRKEKTIERAAKKNSTFCKRHRASNKLAQEHFILSGGIFGLLPDSILEGVEDSLLAAANRYRYTISVPNMYHIAGRDGVKALQTKNGGKHGKPVASKKLQGLLRKKERSRRLGGSTVGI